MPRYPFQSRPTPDGSKGDVSLLTIYSDRPSLAYTGVYPPPPNPIFLPGPFLQGLFCPLVNPQLCPFLEGPRAKPPKYHRILPYLPLQNPLPAGLPSYQSLSPMPSLATPRPLLSWSFLPPSPTKLFPGGPPTPGSSPPATTPYPGQGWCGAHGRLGRGGAPSGVGEQPAWRRWRGDSRLSRAGGPRQALQQGGQAGQEARWVTTAAAAGGGGKRRGQGRGSTRGTQGRERQVDGGGEGRVNPRPAGPAPRSHWPPGTQASGLPFWRAARASGQA